ncbi:MAG: hypothetical protein JNM95_01335 [Chitinophagaceae bacterium]|nr:hypothetical protein [Chitinophagaceae bacterium]
MTAFKKSILLGLNEINFDYIISYNKQGKLPHFNKLFEQYGIQKTTSEGQYELLEPWIQWVTVHTGKTYEEHKIFRLGDIVDRNDLIQLWNIAEEKGLTVAAVSPFNARNDLKAPLFFVPDPWTKTPSSGNPLLKRLSKAVSQAVNDNANERLEMSSVMALIQGLVTYVPAAKYGKYLNLIKDIRKPGTKAVILDSLLADIFIKEWKKTQPDFSSLFLNTGAHIQHHYMFNSEVYDGSFKNPTWYCEEGYDPLYKILAVYDDLLGVLMASNVRLFVCTGLHQQPHEKLTFYWRLKEHAQNLRDMGVENMKEVLPRMSRDVLIEFISEDQAQKAQQVLESYKVNQSEVVFQVDNRGRSLFVELVYPNDIKDNVSMHSSLTGKSLLLKPMVAFVAIKNGEHNGEGYFVDTFQKPTSEETIPLTQVFHRISSSF